jgi:tetratricopeptide (TPR) repeat protein
MRSRQRLRRRALVIVSMAMALSLAAGAQRYTPPAADLEPLPMHASCVADAGADVDRGVALLVLLATDEARRAFERATTSDPDCALGYWGQAISGLPAANDPLTEAMLTAAAVAVTRAHAVAARTPLERSLVEAATALFTPPQPTPIGRRLEAWESRLGQLAQAHPDIIALTILHARAALLRTTLPGDPARERAARVIETAFRDRPLPAGAAVALIEASEGRLSATVARRASEALGRVRLPAPHHLALRALAEVGDWDGAVRAGEAALGYAGAGASATLLYGRRGDFAVEPLVEAWLQQGRRAAARALLTRVTAEIAAADLEPPVDHALRRGLARAVARLIVEERSPALVAVTGPQEDERAGAAWPWRFSVGLVNAWHAWPGGNVDRLRDAKASLDALSADFGAASDVDPERELARVLVEATMAASQDEQPQVTLLLLHAADVEARLITTGRLTRPLQPTRELAAEIWLRFYRYPDAAREARAALERFPNRWRAWLTLARATAALKQPDESLAAWRRVAEIRAQADEGDAAREEARRAAR